MPADKPDATLLCLIPLGCPKNLVDAERMLGQLALDGFVLTDDPAAADVVVVNTCDFIGPATAESREAIRRAALLKREGRCRRLVVAGCMAQRRRQALLEDFPEIDALVGVFDRERIVEACQPFPPEKTRQPGTARAMQEDTPPPPRGDPQGTGRGEGRGPSTASSPQPSPRPLPAREREPVAGPAAWKGEAAGLAEQDGRVLVGEPRAVAPDVERFRLTPHHTAYLRIAEGCDNRCAYCVIPSIRGPLRSKPIETVVAEARELAGDGAAELNLIAQDTTAYGRDWPSAGADLWGHDSESCPHKSRSALVHLLRALEGVEGVRWLRLLYAHPAHLTDDLIAFLAASPKMCRYVDLPLQHASDRILERMGRKVTAAHIHDVIGRLRDRIPRLTLRTTFIVGFPGETEDDFARVLDLVHKVRFERLGAFLYSREPGTPAADLPDQVDAATAERRLHDLMALQQQIAFEQNRALVGGRMEVVVDGPSPRFRRRCLARGEAHAPEIDGGVHVRGSVPPGTFLNVRITGWKDYDLLADRA